TAMADVGAKLEEVGALDLLQAVGDPVQFGVLRRIVPDAPRRALFIRVASFEAGAVALRAEAGEVDAGFVARAAAHQADGAGSEGDANDAAHLREILKDEIVPVPVADSFAEPGAGLLLRVIGKFVEFI